MLQSKNDGMTDHAQIPLIIGRNLALRATPRNSS
jgi:hypothetical protein